MGSIVNKLKKVVIILLSFLFLTLTGCGDLYTPEEIELITKEYEEYLAVKAKYPNQEPYHIELDNFKLDKAQPIAFYSAYVLQNLGRGNYLVQIDNSYQFLNDTKIIHITKYHTAELYDGDRISTGAIFKYLGAYRYENLYGSVSTVPSFEFINEIRFSHFNYDRVRTYKTMIRFTENKQLRGSIE